MKKLIFILITIILFSCSEDDNSGNTIENDLITIIGEIELPSESSIELNSLTINTSINQTNTVDGQFETEISNEYTGIYVENETNETVLMGYYYPDRLNNNINSSSTALALVMMSPSIVFLSESGKQNFINAILNDSNFSSLVEEIEENLITNRSLYDETNSQLQNALTSLFQSVSSRTQNGENIPVLVNSAGRFFSFNAGQGNLPNAYSTVISVLKDNIKVDELLVEGVKLVPNSVEDILTGNGGTFDDPVEVSYTLQGDGEFTFKFYTGKPGFGDGSPEHDKAFYENLGSFSNNLLLTLIPFLDNNDTACLSTIRNNVISTIQTISDVSSNSNAGIGTILYSVNSVVLNNLDGLITCGTNSGININYNWFNKFTKQWNFINTAFNVISNGANTFNFSIQWAQTTSISECCYNAIGNDVQECENEVDLTGCLHIVNTNTTSGNCGWTSLYYLINENNSIFITNNLCSEDFGQPFQTVSYSFTNNNFTLNYSSSQTGATESLVFNGIYDNTQNRINGTWSSSTTQNEETNNCTGEFSILVE